MSDFSNDPRYQALQAVRKEIEFLSDPMFVNAVVASLVAYGRLTEKSSADEIDQALRDVVFRLSLIQGSVETSASHLLAQRQKDEEILKSYFPGINV